MVSTSWFLFSLNALVKLERIRDRYLSRNTGVQDDLEGIHTISRMMCVIWPKMLRGFLSLCLAYVEPKVMTLLVIIGICAIAPGRMT